MTVISNHDLHKWQLIYSLTGIQAVKASGNILRDLGKGCVSEGTI